MPTVDRVSLAALICLILVHAVMLMALFAGVEPHPPARVAPFGMAPFLSAMMSAGLAAMILGAFQTPAGTVFAIAAAVMSLVSFGPHKVFDPAFPLIWPAFATVWISIAALTLRFFAVHRAGPEAQA